MIAMDGTLTGRHKASRGEEALLSYSQLQKADLDGAQLQKGGLWGAQLQNATLRRTNVQGAYLRFVQLQGAILYCTQLQGADLESASFDATTHLVWTVLGDKKQGADSLADVRWNDVNLAKIDWESVTMLGDEQDAYEKRSGGNELEKRRLAYLSAVRANRQLAVILQSQGLNRDAARFGYRAQVLQQHILWFQIFQPGVNLRRRIQSFRAWLFSWFLFLIAGYGYKPGRSFLAYFLTISGFATTYYFLGHNVGPTLSPLRAFVFSMTSFHGRGFFTGSFSPADPQALVAAIEAFFGLLIEVTFIATLTRRLFGR